MPHGQNINSKAAVHQDSISLETIVFNVLFLCSGTPLQEDAPHAHQTTFTTQPQRDVNAQFLAMPQQHIIHQQDSANAQLIPKVLEEFGMPLTSNANAHLNSHCGMENIV